MPATVALATPPPPGLAEATKNSTGAWQQHLGELFRRAKDRFPDVVWELNADEEVWGHKAIVYARAPPSFQSRYFSFRPANGLTPCYPSTSAISLPDSPSPIPPSVDEPSSSISPITSLLRIPSSTNPALFSNQLEYLYTGAQGFGEAFEFLFDAPDSHDPDLEEADPDDLRIDKLRKDLVFMWRSRLYSDVRIALSGNFSSHESNTTAIFSSHRFILVSRSPYFHDALISWNKSSSASSASASLSSSSPEQIPTLTLPSPPFTPPSLHFTLGFIYTGTLVFSHRTYDLSTAFAILKAALYLSLSTLHDEIQARIAHEMLHGLFHAFLPFQEYERLTGGKWGTGGCRCRQCARRVPRVLEFSLEEDVKNTNLERGARRAMVGLYGEGWCTQEFANLNPKLRESLLKGVAKRTTPQNALPLLFSAEHALLKLSSNIETWGDTVKEMILVGRKGVDECICKEAETVFANEEWMEIMQSDGQRFEDTERTGWVMSALLRGVKEPWAASLYQTLVSSVLIKPHPTEPNSPFLSPTSQIRSQVESTRIELLKWISKRWLQIRQERGFDMLEGWSIKEISDYMEVPIDDLLNPVPPPHSHHHHHHTTPRGSRNISLNNPPTTTRHHSPLRPLSNHPHTSRIDADSETASSMRVSVLSRNLGAGTSRRTPTINTTNPNNTTTPSIRERDRDNASVHSTLSVSSVRTARTSTSTSTIGRNRIQTGDTGLGGGAGGGAGGMSPAKRIVQATRAKDAANAAAAAAIARKKKERPDSKLTPVEIGGGSSSLVKPEIHLSTDEDDDDDAQHIEVGEGEKKEIGEGDGDESMVNEHEPDSPTSPTTTTTSTTSTATTTTTAGGGGSSGGLKRKPTTTKTGRTTTTFTGLKTSPGSVRSKASNVSVRSQVSPSNKKPPTTPITTGTTSRTGNSRPVSRSGTRTKNLNPNSTSAAGARSSVASTTSTNSTATTNTSTTSTSSAISSTTSGSMSTSPSRPVSAISNASSTSSTTSTSTTTTTAAAAGRDATNHSNNNNRSSTLTLESTGSYRTASSGGGSVHHHGVGAGGLSSPQQTRSRKSSTSSIRTTGPPGGGTSPISPISPSSLSTNNTTTRTRKISGNSVNSVSSAASSSVYGTAKSGLSSKGGGGQHQQQQKGGKKEKEKPPPVPAIDITKLGPAGAVGKGSKPSATSVRSVRSVSSIKKTPTTPTITAGPSALQKSSSVSGAVEATIPSSVGDSKATTMSGDEGGDTQEEEVKNTPSTLTIKPPAPRSRSRSPPPPPPPNVDVDVDEGKGIEHHKKTDSTTSIGSTATVKKKRSNETIIASVPTDTTTTVSTKRTSGRLDKPQPPLPTSSPATEPIPIPPASSEPPGPMNIDQQHSLSSDDDGEATHEPQGATLEIGIPCIVSSKRKRFKAYARYIGEVFGEYGPWVGVEVPIPLGESWADRDIDMGWQGTQWNDGTWAGIRYFEIGSGGGSGGKESDYFDERVKRKINGRKREGEQMSMSMERKMKRIRSVSPAVSDASNAESRGLFVRPQQVLYVVDAVEDL